MKKLLFLSMLISAVSGFVHSSSDGMTKFLEQYDKALERHQILRAGICHSIKKYLETQAFDNGQYCQDLTNKIPGLKIIIEEDIDVEQKTKEIALSLGCSIGCIGMLCSLGDIKPFKVFAALTILGSGLSLGYYGACYHLLKKSKKQQEQQKKQSIERMINFINNPWLKTDWIENLTIDERNKFFTSLLRKIVEMNGIPLCDLNYMQKLDPEEYKNYDSLRLKFLSKEKFAMQLLVADTTHTDVYCEKA